MDNSDTQCDKSDKMLDRHFVKVIKTFEEAGLSITADKNNMIKLVENYLEGIQKLMFQESDSKLKVNRSTMKNEILPTGVTSENNDENSSVFMNRTRKVRQAAEVASIKVKKNLNFPVKLRRPSTDSEIEASINKNSMPLAEITNGQPRTKVIRKCNRSEVPHLPDADAVTQNQTESIAPVTDVADVGGEEIHNNVQTPRQNEVITANGQAAASGPLSIVKLRTMQFENLAVKAEESVKRTLFESLSDTEKKDDGKIKSVEKEEKTLLPHSASQEEIDSQATSRVGEDKKYLRVVLERFSLHNAGQPSEQQEPLVQERNKTFVATDSSKTPTVSTVSNARVTRAMTMNNKIQTSDESASSEASTKSARGRGKKRSAVTVKCKKYSKSAKLMENLKKKPELDKKKEIRRNREEKMNKAKEAALRKQEEAKAAQEKKAEKIREIAAEREKWLKEEEAKKAAVAKQKKLEVEERRKKEEAARIARLKEIEEEHKRAEAALQKKKEQAEALRQKKLAQDIKNASKPQLQDKEKPVTPTMMKKKQMKVNSTFTLTADADNYEMTPDRANRVLKSPKSNLDYGIDDAGSSDSTEDEDHPKKMIPAWAEKKRRIVPININSYIPLEMWNLLYKNDNNPQLIKLLGVKCKRARTSSAIWTTPPLR